MKILVAGDFAPQNRVNFQIERRDYSCLENVETMISMVDYSIVNFECPILMQKSPPIDKTGSNLWCSEKAMECISQVGFNCVTLANNHFRDFGQRGVEDTLTACRKYNVDYVGGGMDMAEATKILYKDINGQRLAIINVCENEWSIADEKRGGAAPLNPIQVFYMIQSAKKNDSIVLVIIHGGIELYQYPTPHMQEVYRFFINAGADAVVNHHQHCFSGYEIYEGKPIFYGLGNFCFDNNNFRNILWTQGYMVTLQFENGNVHYELIPYNQCSDIAKIICLNELEREVFYDTIIRINEVISDSSCLRSRFDMRVKIDGARIFDVFEPIRNKFVKKLRRMKLLPSLVFSHKRNLIHNVIRCESHREVLLRFLENE
ncbi:MAG: CapA family protein [Bacteroidales bacterium]|nr:CapA family protein [Bacteroidales bacterium]MBR4498049.1 CapA family protein [Bacteroidales bacterium]